MRQVQIDGPPQPPAPRRGRRGPQPKPAELKPKRFARVPIYEWDDEPMAKLKAANPGTSEAALFRGLMLQRAAAISDDDLPPTSTQEQLPV